MSRIIIVLNAPAAIPDTGLAQEVARLAAETARAKNGGHDVKVEDVAVEVNGEFIYPPTHVPTARELAGLVGRVEEEPDAEVDEDDADEEDDAAADADAAAAPAE